MWMSDQNGLRRLDEEMCGVIWGTFRTVLLYLFNFGEIHTDK